MIDRLYQNVFNTRRNTIWTRAGRGKKKCQYETLSISSPSFHSPSFLFPPFSPPFSHFPLCPFSFRGSPRTDQAKETVPRPSSATRLYTVTKDRRKDKRQSTFSCSQHKRIHRKQDAQLSQRDRAAGCVIVLRPSFLSPFFSPFSPPFSHFPLCLFSFRGSPRTDQTKETVRRPSSATRLYTVTKDRRKNKRQSTFSYSQHKRIHKKKNGGDAPLDF